MQYGFGDLLRVSLADWGGRGKGAFILRQAQDECHGVGMNGGRGFMGSYRQRRMGRGWGKRRASPFSRRR